MMSYSRWKQLHQGQTAIAKRVYEAVPISEAWTVNQIQSEMERLGHSAKAYKIICGCLQYLKEAGLLAEPKPSTYVRLPVAPAPSQLQDEARHDHEPDPAPIRPALPIVEIRVTKTPLEKLTSLSSRVADLTRKLSELSSDLETAALEIDEQMQANAAQSKKFQQLQKLLLNDGGIRP